MKKCPYCAEEIQDEAVKCRYCHEFLDESKRPVPLAAPAQAGNPLPWYFKTSFIVLMFVSLPPVALPLVWLHPKLHLVWKIGITLVIGGVCWVIYFAFKGFVGQLDNATDMWKESPI